MKKSDIKFKEEIQELLSKQELNDSIRLVLDNAVQRLEDGRFNKSKAEEYIFYWMVKFKNEFEFTPVEKELYLRLKPKKGVPVTVLGMLGRLFS